MNKLAATVDFFGNKEDRSIISYLKEERDNENKRLMHVIKYGKYWEAHLEFKKHYGFDACCDRAAMAARCKCWNEHVKKHRIRL